MLEGQSSDIKKIKRLMGCNTLFKDRIINDFAKEKIDTLPELKTPKREDLLSVIKENEEVWVRLLKGEKKLFSVILGLMVKKQLDPQTSKKIIELKINESKN